PPYNFWPLNRRLPRLDQRNLRFTHRVELEDKPAATREAPHQRWHVSIENYRIGQTRRRLTNADAKAVVDKERQLSGERDRACVSNCVTFQTKYEKNESSRPAEHSPGPIIASHDADKIIFHGISFCALRGKAKAARQIEVISRNTQAVGMSRSRG